MGDPYRSAGDGAAAAEAPSDPGLVGEVIAQFADTYAFLRELVQNAIDAGTPHVDVAIARADGGATVAVADRGEGMSRDTIENQLLVLFRSTKESDPRKIGKFGIGFASVLAPDPALVVVRTARAGQRLELHLARDLTYRLFDAGRTAQAGTTVTLELPCATDAAYAAIVARARAALVRWCQHASVPIALAVDGAPPESIVRPLAVEDCSVVLRREEGPLVVSVGLPRGKPGYVEYYNHGLLLYATRGNACVKIQDPRLGHTLSRDNVRRDAVYDHATAFASAAVDELGAAVSLKLEKLARDGMLAEHAALVADAREARLGHVRYTFPLAGGGTAGAMPYATQRHADPDFVAQVRAELGGALACVGPKEPFAAHVEALMHTFDDAPKVVFVEDVFARIVVDPAPEPRIAGLLARAAEVIARVRRAVPLVPARFAGAHADALALIPHKQRQFVAATDAQDDPFKRLFKPTLAVNVAHPLVAEAARRDPVRAGSLVARAILLRYGALDVARSEQLVADALARLELDA